MCICGFVLVFEVKLKVSRLKVFYDFTTFMAFWGEMGLYWSEIKGVDKTVLEEKWDFGEKWRLFLFRD